jgi:hypothetical protein
MSTIKKSFVIEKNIIALRKCFSISMDCSVVRLSAEPAQLNLKIIQNILLKSENFKLTKGSLLKILSSAGASLSLLV